MSDFAVSLNWPTVVLVIGVIGLFVFRGPIAAMIGRTKKLGIGKSAWEGQDIPQAPSSAAAIEGPLDQFQQGFLNQLLLQQEEVVRKSLRDLKLEAPVDREKALIRTVAALQITVHFDRVAAVIYASQLALLVHLNERPAGDDSANLKALFFDPAAKNFAQLYQQYPYENYLGFLESWLLVERVGTVTSITLAGREFLKYLVENRRILPTWG